MWKFLNYIKWKLTKKLLIKLLWIVLILWIGTMFLAKNQAFAVWSNDVWWTTILWEQTKQMSQMNDLFSQISRAIYALLWPVLFVAWIALDNRLVYGSFLHLDASLWALWNIMKNFANFALWFMVLFAIVRNIFTAPFGKSWDKRWPVSIIKKTLIAGVLIQASWFLIAAVIDVSTILTYSIWWLPMTVLQNNPVQSDLPILWISADLSKKEEGNKMSLNYYNTYWDIKISTCQTKIIPWLTWKYIVGRKDIKIDNDNYFYTWICTIWSWPYRYKENPAFLWQSSNSDYHDLINVYFGSWNSNSPDPVDFNQLESDCIIIPTEYSRLTWQCSSQNYWILKKSDNFFNVDQSSSWGIAYKIDNLLDKSKWFVGPFITIYSSLLDFSTIASDPPGESVLEDFFQLIIKIFFAIVLFVPLLALAVVLIARIWLLRIIIVASPIMALLAVFGEVLNMKWKSDWMMWNFTWPNIIKLIFAPVFVVFAISMSMIFLSALNPKNTQKGQWPTIEQMSEIWMEKIDDKTYSILWLVEITLDISKVNEWMDMFAWFITMFFSTGIVRFFLFFAIRMTKIWESVGKWLQESMQNLAKNLPIIPIGWWWIWISAAKQWIKDLSNKLPTQMNTAQMEELRKKYPWLYGPTSDENRWDGDNSLSKVSTGLQTEIIKSFALWKTADEIYSGLGVQAKGQLKTAWISSATALGASYNYINNFASSITGGLDENKVNTLQVQWYRVDTITLYANQKWSQRNDWAKDKVWHNVRTADWIKVIVNVWLADNPQFKFVDPLEYNETYLGVKDWKVDENKIKNALETDYNNNKPMPKDYDEAERKKEKEVWIAAEIKKHMEYADERLKIPAMPKTDTDTDTKTADADWWNANKKPEKIP